MSFLRVSAGWHLPRRALTQTFRVGKCRQVRSKCWGSNSASASCRRGALIVFEGIDRCGKSTQSSMLMDSLRSEGANVQHWCFPDRTTQVGQLINGYLQGKGALDDTVIHLLFTANRFEKREEMLRLLAAGTTLILDRYSYSGVAYTAAKGVPHLSVGYCCNVEAGLPAADLVVFMDISPEESAARGGYGQERYENLDFQCKVVEQYRALKDERWLTLDARAPLDQIHRQVMAAAKAAIKDAGEGAALGRLWDCVPLELPVQTDACTGRP